MGVVVILLYRMFMYFQIADQKRHSYSLSEGSEHREMDKNQKGRVEPLSPCARGKEM
jgi:hypothetical protein